MRRFLSQIIFIIFLPIVFVLGVCEYVLRSVPNDHTYKHQFLMTNKNKIKILSFGSSHGYYGIQPKFFSKSAFNMAFVSQSLKYDKFLYEKYAISCDSLEYIILPISYFSLRSNLEKSQEWWRIKGYCIYMGCDYHQYDLFYNLEIASKDKLRSIFDYMLCDTSFINCDSLGWGINYRLESRHEEWQKTGSIACNRHTKQSLEYVEDNKQYLKDIIDVCSKRNLKVILLTTPTYHTYYELLDSIQLKEMEDICSQFEVQNEHVVYLNWLKHSDFTEDDFYDADHLNEYGAEKLTRMLDQYILSWE